MCPASKSKSSTVEISKSGFPSLATAERQIYRHCGNIGGQIQQWKQEANPETTRKRRALARHSSLLRYGQPGHDAPAVDSAVPGAF
eukprot:scaffold260_cov274-Pinguiococcus_pyrenoidosus.AAC.5